MNSALLTLYNTSTKKPIHFLSFTHSNNLT